MNGFKCLMFVVAASLSALIGIDASAAVEPDLVEMAEMSDGVSLSTAVHLPDPGVFSAPYPTVLLRTPYPDILGQVDDSVAEMIISYMVDLFGLALVVQDTRGTGASQGEPDAFFSDWMDGAETVDWLAEQEWCDGQVLQFGLSALAIPGYLAAPNAPDNLKCQFLGEGAPDMYNLGAFHGGVFKKSTVESWLSWVRASSRLAELELHRSCDEFWNPLMIDRIDGDIHAGAMHIGGWYDVFVEGTIAGFRTYRDRGDEWAAANQYMVIGPWDHWSLAESLAVNQSYGYPMQSDMLAWVSYCLAGDDSVVRKWPRVRYYVMGSSEEDSPGNEWRSAPDWPPPTEYTAFFIQDDGTLVTGDESGPSKSASRVVPGDEDVVEVTPVLPASLPFSHQDYSPVVGGRNLVGSAGPRDLSKVLARNDYVMFQTNALSEPFESIGRMSITLDVSTRFADADVIVRLADIYPDGSAIIISDGAARMSARDGCDAAAEVVSGERYSVDVDLLTSAMVFNTGHRIGVIVTTTMYRKYEFNPVLLAESEANGPIEDALVIHGGTLFMPVAQDFPVVPETVEAVEFVEQVEFVESVERDVIDTEMVDVTADVLCDGGTDVGLTDGLAVDDTIPDDGPADDSQTGDSRPDIVWTELSSEVKDSSTAAADEGSLADVSIQGGSGGCSAADGGGSAAPLTLLLLGTFVIVRLRRRARFCQSTHRS